jgi:hypothetical protein
LPAGFADMLSAFRLGRLRLDALATSSGSAQPKGLCRHVYIDRFGNVLSDKFLAAKAIFGGLYGAFTQLGS